MPIRPLLLAALCVALAACSSAPPRDMPRADDAAAAGPVAYREVSTLTAVADAVAQLPDTTLVVFDIDDTLLSTPVIDASAGTGLAARRFFGSDTWYNWQKNVPASDPQHVSCLFDVIAIHTETGVQEPVPDAAATLDRIDQDMIYLTSRSPDARGGTRRELARANLLPRRQQPTPALFIPHAGAMWTFADGIFMTQGGNKGTALLALLAELDDADALPREYTDIVLVDDGWKNIRQMHEELAKAGIRYHGFLYTGIKRDPTTGSAQDTPWPLPNAGTRAAATDAWKAWLAALEVTYPERAARISLDRCGIK